MFPQRKMKGFFKMMIQEGPEQGPGLSKSIHDECELEPQAKIHFGDS